jgi:hypothetical protein
VEHGTVLAELDSFISNAKEQVAVVRDTENLVQQAGMLKEF